MIYVVLVLFAVIISLVSYFSFYHVDNTDHEEVIAENEQRIKQLQNE